MCHAALAAAAADAEPRWLLDTHGCKFLNPYPSDVAPFTIEWTGQCVDGYVSGQGEIRLPPDLTYRGEFVQGRILKGSAELRGEIYEGEFLDNRPHGRGTSRSPTGSAITATYVRGMIESTNVELTWPNKNHYRGEVDTRTKQMHGKGALQYADGSVYEGEFNQGSLEGAGVLKRPDGEIRSGTFRGGQLEGKGSVLYANQARYEGELRVGQPNGHGHLQFASGESYDGAFVAGHYQGKGTLKYADGTVYDGYFLAGDPSGTGTMTLPDGERYEGQFLYGRRHGTGKVTLASGDSKEGEWKAGVLTGKCRTVSGQGVYEGECIDGKASGTGRLEVRAQKLAYQGGFRNDVFEGQGSLHLGELSYDGMFKGGVMDGPGALVTGKLSMHGDFSAGVLVRGTINAADGRTFEIDVAKGEMLEVQKDGSKHPIDQLPPDITI